MHAGVTGRAGTLHTSPKRVVPQVVQARAARRRAERSKRGEGGHSTHQRLRHALPRVAAAARVERAGHERARLPGAPAAARHRTLRARGECRCQSRRVHARCDAVEVPRTWQHRSQGPSRASRHRYAERAPCRRGSAVLRASRQTRTTRPSGRGGTGQVRRQLSLALLFCEAAEPARSAKGLCRIRRRTIKLE